MNKRDVLIEKIDKRIGYSSEYYSLNKSETIRATKDILNLCRDEVIEAVEIINEVFSEPE